MMVELAAEGLRAGLDVLKWSLHHRGLIRKLPHTISELHGRLDEAQVILLESCNDEGASLDLGLIIDVATFLENMERMRSLKRFIHVKRHLDRAHELLQELKADIDAHERRRLQAGAARREAERQAALTRFHESTTVLLGQQLREIKWQNRMLYGIIILFDLGTHPA